MDFVQNLSLYFFHPPPDLLIWYILGLFVDIFPHKHLKLQRRVLFKMQLRLKHVSVCQWERTVTAMTGRVSVVVELMCPLRVPYRQ